MLTSKDLMIGDWINTSLGISKVVCLDDGIMFKGKDKNGLDVVFRDGGITLKPIPLTAEILEKNGFEFGYTASEEEFCSAVGCGYPEEKGWCYDDGAGEIKIIFPNDTDGGLIRLDDQSADRHLELIFCKPVMVHELQHAMRLCDIKKEIEL